MGFIQVGEMILAGSSLHSKWLTLDKGVYELTYCEVLCLGGRNNLVGEVLVGEAVGTAESIADQMLGEAMGEVGFAGGDEVTKLLEIGEFGAVVKFAGCVDEGGGSARNEPSFIILDQLAFLGSPFAGSVKVFKPEAYGVDLAVATGTLGFFLVGGKFLTSGEGLVVQTGELGNVGGCRRRGIIEKVTQYPGTAFDGATLDAVTTHGVDGGHAKKSTARGTFLQRNLLELVSSDSINAVVVGQEAIDENMVTFQKFSEASFFRITQ